MGQQRMDRGMSHEWAITLPEMGNDLVDEQRQPSRDSRGKGALAITRQATQPSEPAATPMTDLPAAITGDFVLVAAEVNSVAQTLQKAGIDVTALHNHHLGEDPRLFYMHFFATGDATKLAQGLRAAIDQTNSKPS